jgi:hypothetical protein
MAANDPKGLHSPIIGVRRRQTVQNSKSANMLLVDGSPIRAVANGVVISPTGLPGVTGHSVVIQADNKFIYAYYGLKAPGLPVGTVVEMGDVIGAAGSSAGRPSAPRQDNAQPGFKFAVFTKRGSELVRINPRRGDADV